jgi:mannosyltransferase OCH1-like enzyme
MIPKIIHYCWFGGNPIPQEHAAYIEGWRRLLPGYEFKRWDEGNFDISIVSFTAQVAATKKWGFIVDYIRAWTVFNYGGIYIDTDVELLKSLDDLLESNICLSGFENEKFINPGNIFAGEKGCVIAKELMDFYASYNFIGENGEPNLTPSPKIFTDLLLKYGLKQNGAYQVLKDGIFTAYPAEYFCPMQYLTGKLTITKNTYSIHHYDGSWLTEEQKNDNRIVHTIYRKFGDTILSKFLKILVLTKKRIKHEGIITAIRALIKSVHYH